MHLRGGKASTSLAGLLRRLKERCSVIGEQTPHKLKHNEAPLIHVHPCQALRHGHELVIKGTSMKFDYIAGAGSKLYQACAQIAQFGGERLALVDALIDGLIQ